MKKRSKNQLIQEAQAIQVPFENIFARYKYQRQIVKQLESLNPSGTEDYQIIVGKFTLAIGFAEKGEVGVLTMEVYKESNWIASLQLPEYHKDAVVKVVKTIMRFISIWK